MRLLFVLLIEFFALSPLIVIGQQPADTLPIRFQVSSLSSEFALAGVFEGELRIYPDKIEVVVENGTIYLRDNAPYKGQRKVTAVRVGLGKQISNEDWAIVKKSKSYPVKKMMVPGDEYKLRNVTFSIRKDKRTDLSKHWIIFEMEDYVLNLGAERSMGAGYSYAHSKRDIFAQP